MYAARTLRTASTHTTRERDNTRGAIEKTGSSCPLGFYGSGNYCVSSPSNDREAIQKTGNSCPLGWFSSGSYCVKSR